MSSDTELIYEADPPDGRLRLDHPDLSGRIADAPLARQSIAVPDSDSGDSLFQTQHVTIPLRAERRERPRRLQRPSAAPESDTDTEGDCRPQRPRKSLLKFKRYKPNQETQKKYDRNGSAFPFLVKKNKSEQLPRRKVLLFEHGAIGGFFTYIKKVQDRSEKGSSSKSFSLRRRFLDEDEELLPLSNPEQAEDSQASDDIKIVAQNDFILKFHGRFRGHNTWIQKSSSDAAQDSMKDRRKTSSNLKKSSHVPNVHTRSQVRRSPRTCNTGIEDDGLDNCGITTEQEYDSDTTDQSSLSSDTFPQEGDEERTVTNVLDQQGAVTCRKATRTRRCTQTISKKTSIAPVIHRSTPLDAETARNGEEMPNSELQQSPNVIQLEKQTHMTKSQCFLLPIENCEAGVSNTGTPAKICERVSLNRVTEDAIPHMGSQELGDVSIKRKTERRKESLQEETSDASKEKVMEQAEKVAVEQVDLPENRISLSLNKEGLREDEEAIVNQDAVAEDEAPLTSHDDVPEMISTTAVSVQDEQDHSEHAPSQNTLEKPTEKTPHKILKGSSGCKYELNEAIRKKQHMSQEVILNHDDVRDLWEMERGADSQNIGLENEGSEELFDNSYGQGSAHGEESSVEEEMTQDVCAQSTTDSQSKKPSAETIYGKGEEEVFTWNLSKSERQRRKKARKKDLNVGGADTIENVSLLKKGSEKHVKVLDLQDDLNEEGRASATVAKSPSHSNSCIYNQTMSKQVISETCLDQISGMGSHPPEPKDDDDFDVACHDLEERRRRKKKKRNRGEKEEQFSISGSPKCLPALNSPTHEGTDRERYLEPVEMPPLSSSNDMVKKKEKKKMHKPGGAEQSDELGGGFIASCSGSFPGGEKVRLNIAEDQPMEFDSQWERYTTDLEHHDVPHQPNKKKRKKERDSDNGDRRKSTREILSCTVNLKTRVTSLQLSPGLQSEASRETKAGRSNERKGKLVSHYDSGVSKFAGTDTDRDGRGETADVQDVTSGVNAKEECGKVSHGKSKYPSLCDKEGQGTLQLVKQRPSKQKLFAIRRFQRLQRTGSYIHQTLIWNYLHSKKGHMQRQNAT